MHLLCGIYSQKASLWEHASSLEDKVNSTWQDQKGVSVPVGGWGRVGLRRREGGGGWSRREGKAGQCGVEERGGWGSVE